MNSGVIDTRISETGTEEREMGHSTEMGSKEQEVEGQNMKSQTQGAWPSVREAQRTSAWAGSRLLNAQTCSP